MVMLEQPTAKPAKGTWSETCGMDNEHVSYEDSISPEFYEAEREAIFKRCWLNVGRVEELPKVGSYFTKELAVADTSIIVARGKDGKIRAFHNMCRHRGNKLVWTDYPEAEERGSCRQFSCKYHGWRYALDGELTYVSQERDFANLDKSEFGLAEVTLDLWEGFIFINLSREPVEPLREFLGEMAWGIEGYPFEKMTHVFRYRAEVKSNWKIFVDTFAEFYHSPYLHGNQTTPAATRQQQEFGFRAAFYRTFGPHRVSTLPGTTAPDMDEKTMELMVKPIDRLIGRLARGGAEGSGDESNLLTAANLPRSFNPQKADAWAGESFQFFPNWVILAGVGSYFTYHYWPTSVGTHIFEGTLYFLPPKTPGERLMLENTAVSFKEFGLQDANTLEATQSMLKSRAVTKFPLSDEETLVRHLHKTVREWVSDYQA